MSVLSSNMAGVQEKGARNDIICLRSSILAHAFVPRVIRGRQLGNTTFQEHAEVAVVELQEVGVVEDFPELLFKHDYD